MVFLCGQGKDRILHDRKIREPQAIRRKNVFSLHAANSCSRYNYQQYLLKVRFFGVRF